MIKRDIEPSQVEQVIHHGQTLRVYPQSDEPDKYLRYAKVFELPDMPERPLQEREEEQELELEQEEGLGIEGKPISQRPLHVVASDKLDRQLTVVITVYEPDEDEWTDDYRWRTSWSSTKNTWRE